MTSKADTSPNYGSLSRDSMSSTSEEEGGDTFAASQMPGRRPPRFSLTRDPSHGTTHAPKNMRTSNVYTQSVRRLFDGWLMRDYSVKGGMTSLRHLEKFIGPTDHHVEDMIRDHGGLGLEYKSVDRGIMDTAIWHRRKTKLIKEKRAGINESFKGEVKSPVDEGYDFDHEAVHQLEKEREWMEWALVVGIGFLMAIIGIMVSNTADYLLDWKLESAMEWLEYGKFDGFSSSWYFGLAQHVVTSVFLAMLAFIPVAIAPISGGSGIAEAKAVLNGIMITNCTAISTCACKAVSVICSVAASLPAGLEGPMIFMGLSIGENANRLVPRNRPAFDLLRTDRKRIDFAAIGCAAGVAAAFRSPISGVLFAMEEGSSYWSTHLTWRCFLSACVTVISMYAIISKVFGNGEGFHVNSMAVFSGINKDPSSNLATDDSAHPDFDLWEYGMFALVGIGGGIIGGMFCTANRSLALLRRQLSLSTAKKGIEVFLIATITAILIWILPSLFGGCSDIGGRRLGHTYYRQFNCEEGEYNELATLLLNPLGAKGITLLFTEDDIEAFSIQTCIIAGILHLFILCVAFGMSVSAGIFIPLLFIGSCFGRAFALICNLYLDDAWNIDPRTYAIIGAAATLGGVVRVLISLTAIVTHTTSLSFFMTPVMLSTLLAQNVGNWVSGRPGIYDIILQLRGVPFLEEECPIPARHANIRARNVMSKNLKTVSSEMLVQDLVGILRSNDYSDFPVVDKQDHSLVGMISRVDLLAVIASKSIFFSMRDNHGVLSYSELDQARPDPRDMPTGDEIGAELTPEDELKYVYIGPYMQIAPISIQGHGSAERAYEIFRNFGLRSIVVVDKHSHPIGIITRHGLALLEEIGEHEEEIEEKKIETFLYSQRNIDTQFE